MRDNAKPISHLKSLLHKPHFKIALIYLVVSVLWIIYSDKILFSTFQDVQNIEHFQLLKGLFFVVGTALLIFFLIRKSYNKVKVSNSDLQERDKQLKQRNKQQAILLKISSILAKNLELKSLLQSVTDSAANLLGLPTTAIYLVEKNDIVLGATSPPIPPDFPDEFRKADLTDHPHIEKALRSKHLVIIHDTSKTRLTEEERVIVETRNLRSLLYIPLILEGEAQGVLIAGKDDAPVKFSQEEIELANGLANQAVLAITNAKLSDNLKKYTKQLETHILGQKLTEDQLRKSEEKFRNLFENHSAIKFIINVKTGAIVNANKAAAKFYGWSVETLEKMKISEINLLPEDEVYKIMEDAKKQEKVFFEFKHRKADGSIADVEVYSTVMKIDGEDHLHSVLHDVTDKKKTELQLYKLSLAVEQNPASIVITNLKGDIEYVNPTFLKITGYSFDEVVNKNPRMLKSGDQSDEFYKDMWNTITSGNTWSGVLHNKKKNGKLFWESAIISPIKNDKNQITHFVAVKEDITDDVKREMELQKYRENLEELVAQRTRELDKVNFELRQQLDKGKLLEKQLEESLSKEKEINELKTRFIATVSHEFRTPLSALLSSTQMIQRYSSKWSEEKLNQHHTRIESTVKYLTQLLDDVLTISRADREILKNEPELVNICNLLNSFMDEVRSHIDVERRVNIFCDINDSEMKVDKKLLRHVVINLITNGIKYSPQESEVNLNATYHNNKLLLTVSDNGIGIPEDEIKYIFDAFYRTKNSIGVPGSGLGLNIVKRAVETMNGTISVNSVIDKGTTFTVTIPIN
ncbi:MAG: PAS domain S-box protein [Melioribacteraceae bacterium]|nr:PAS domain S-box protein [Melioribacteraceae bacterium]